MGARKRLGVNLQLMIQHFRIQPRQVPRIRFLSSSVLLVILMCCGCSSDRPAAEPEKATDKATVAVSGHLSRDMAPEGQPIRFWITIENSSSMPLHDVRLAHMDTPG